MGLKPLSIRKMEAQTEDVFEAVTVISQRAREIIRDRQLDQTIKENLEDEYEAFDELEEMTPEDYVEKDKPTKVATDEFIDGELEWGKSVDFME